MIFYFLILGIKCSMQLYVALFRWCSESILKTGIPELTLKTSSVATGGTCPPREYVPPPHMKFRKPLMCTLITNNNYYMSN